ncbi:hypothetical protein OXT66_03245 [Lentilactobacillus senioris]|uniref:hypothetical protein n=1 Tax=Lentilactobacillus senioris TaxID=931534 RepID=UPI00227E9D56|nr:hypothetical protein [Lentilactobacillus senioris]MCY9806565.1 hypothetical protein [Lentilactobacillus senioris]
MITFFSIGMFIVMLLSCLALFSQDLLGDRQKYQQYAAVCIASIICWAVVMVTALVLA